MTKFKVHRILASGQTSVEVIDAFDWLSLFSAHQFSGSQPIIKVEVIGSAAKAIDRITGEEF